MIGDINGDGKKDIIGFYNDGPYVLESEGRTLKPSYRLIFAYCRIVLSSCGTWS